MRKYGNRYSYNLCIYYNVTYLKFDSIEKFKKLLMMLSFVDEIYLCVAKSKYKLNVGSQKQIKFIINANRICRFVIVCYFYVLFLYCFYR